MISRRDFLTLLGVGAAGFCAANIAGADLTDTAQLPAKEALFWEPLDGNRVRCRLCPKRCVVAEGRRGFCRVRENRAGSYVTLVYGRPWSVRPDDPIEKKPFFHVYPGTRAFSLATPGCNMTCSFCQNWELAQANPEDAPGMPLSPRELATKARASGARVVAYTYNEPTVFYEYMLDCAKEANNQGMESVVISNGFIEDAPQKKLFPFIKAVNVDLKAFTPEFYKNTCSGELQPVLETLRRLSGAGVWFEIIVLLIPGLNDGADEISRMVEWIVRELGRDAPVHFSRFHPMYKMRNLPPTPLETLFRARRQALEQGCRYVYVGNVPGREGQNTVCPFCSTMLIERYGFQVLSNALVDGACPSCKAQIPGVWG